jgi:flagellar biogenesis protein FliO
MTSDQWFLLAKLIVILAFAAFVLYGVYRIMMRDERKDGE